MAVSFPAARALGCKRLLCREAPYVVDLADVAELPLGVTTITGCTIVSNSASSGAGAALGGPTIISRSIIAFGVTGDAISCSASSVALSCTDIFANAGGDWTACIADQVGINGNFSADPRFCAPLAGDFTLAADSPCAPAHSPAGCGTIGSQPVGCATPIGIAEAAAPAAASRLRIMPNPIGSAGVIEWMGHAGNVLGLSLYDATGRLVVRHDLAPLSAPPAEGSLAWSEFIGGRRLGPGVYFLRTFGPQGTKLADQRVVVLR